MKNRCIMALAGAVILAVLGFTAFIFVSGEYLQSDEDDGITAVEADWEGDCVLPTEPECEPLEPLDVVEAVDDVEAIEAIEAIEAVENVDAIENVEAIDAIEPIDTVVDDFNYYSESLQGQDDSDDGHGIINLCIILLVITVATLFLEPMSLAVVFGYGIMGRLKCRIGRLAGLLAVVRPVLLLLIGALFYFGVLQEMLSESQPDSYDEGDELTVNLPVLITLLALSLIATVAYGLLYASFFKSLATQTVKAGAGKLASMFSVLVWLLWAALVLQLAGAGVPTGYVFFPLAGALGAALMLPYFCAYSSSALPTRRL